MTMPKDNCLCVHAIKQTPGHPTIHDPRCDKASPQQPVGRGVPGPYRVTKDGRLFKGIVFKGLLPREMADEICALLNGAERGVPGDEARLLRDALDTLSSAEIVLRDKGDTATADECKAVSDRIDAAMGAEPRAATDMNEDDGCPND
jgi:hypothetical protein